MGKGDLVTILIDTKNEMKRSVDGLDSRVSELDRELRAAFAGEIAELRENGFADLKSSQQETRTSAYNAGKRAGEAVTAVTDLRRSVDQLHDGLEGLRRDVKEVLSLLRVPAGSAPDVPQHAQAEPGGTPAEESAAPDGQSPASHEEEKEGGVEGVEESAPAAEPAVAAGDSVPGDSPPVIEAEADAEGERPEPGAGTQAGPEEGWPEDPQAVSRAASEASERASDDRVQEPDPVSPAGRIWAIMRAGRVASATLICHRDAWEFVAAQAGNHPHFRTPVVEEHDAGLVAAVLSGRSLVAVLLSLYRVAHRPHQGEGADELIAYADWAMAYQVYSETARVLNRALFSEGDPVVVTIDNRLNAAG